MKSIKEPPKYQQLTEDIKAKIASGEYKPGDKLPTERELTEKYGVSRIVATNAYIRLASEGLVTRVSGRGSFVAVPEKRTSPGNEQIALVLPRVSTAYSSELAIAITKYVRRAGYHCPVYYTEGDIVREEEIFELLVKTEVTGIILYPGSASSMNKYIISGAVKPPVVLVDHELPGVALCCAQTDNKMVTSIAVSHLASLGHERIAICSYQYRNQSSLTDRLTGYLNEMAEHKLMVDPMAVLINLESEKELEKLRLILREKRVTAFICLNAYTWSFLNGEMQKLGFSCPKDFSVVAVDRKGIEASLPEHEMTYIKQDTRAVVKSAVAMMVDKINGSREIKTVYIAPTLIHGNTTAPPNRE